jgi:hypothetical protein
VDLCKQFVESVIHSLEGIFPLGLLIGEAHRAAYASRRDRVFTGKKRQQPGRQ